MAARPKPVPARHHAPAAVRPVVRGALPWVLLWLGALALRALYVRQIGTSPLARLLLGDAAAYDRLRALPLDPWAEGEKAHVMRLRPDHITGRRIVRN